MNTTVLIAEDEPLMRERLLEMLGVAWPEARIVMVAENGNDAWDGFLDIRMPGLSGLEVAQRRQAGARRVRHGLRPVRGRRL